MNLLVYNRRSGMSTTAMSSSQHHRILLNNRSCLQEWMRLYNFSTQQHSPHLGGGNNDNNSSSYNRNSYNTNSSYNDKNNGNNNKSKTNKYKKSNEKIIKSNQHKHKHYHHHMTSSYTKPELILNYMSSDEINEELKNNVSVFMSFIKQIDGGLLFNIKADDDNKDSDHNDHPLDNHDTMNRQADCSSDGSSSSSSSNYLSQLSNEQIDVLMSHILSYCNKYKEESSTYYRVLMYCLLSIPSSSSRSGGSSGSNDYKLSSLAPSEDIVKLLKYGKLEVRDGDDDDDDDDDGDC